jgi:CCR4-NOT transcription complex subunit 9
MATHTLSYVRMVWLWYVDDMKMVVGLVDRPSVRLLKHIVRCYLRLSDNTRARDALRGCLPSQLRDSTFGDVV